MSRQITLQSQNPSTRTWAIRAMFVDDNARLNSMIQTNISADLVEDFSDEIKRKARQLAHKWNATYPDRQLRVHDTEDDKRREPASLSSAATPREINEGTYKVVYLSPDEFKILTHLIYDMGYASMLHSNGALYLDSVMDFDGSSSGMKIVLAPKYDWGNK